MMIKVCGITRRADAEAAVAAGCDAIGLNFFPRSPRYIAPEAAAEVAADLGPVLKVGVFVNEPAARVAEIARIAGLDIVQLHGDETAADFPAGLAVWKGVRVDAAFDLVAWADCPAQALLLDGPAALLYGGAGHTFDWSVARESGRAIILAGGLGADNVAEAIERARPWGVDACSRLESEPGIKDHEKMKAFIQAARGASA